jgi:hypothetical protein
MASALHGETLRKRRGFLSAEMRGCSACAGDYEDPDRTAWPVDEEEDDAEQTTEEFPEEGSR